MATATDRAVWLRGDRVVGYATVEGRALRSAALGARFVGRPRPSSRRPVARRVGLLARGRRMRRGCAGIGRATRRTDLPETER